jgi:hypothetical protein
LGRDRQERRKPPTAVFFPRRLRQQGLDVVPLDGMAVTLLSFHEGCQSENERGSFWLSARGGIVYPAFLLLRNSREYEKFLFVCRSSLSGREEGSFDRHL